MRGASDRKAIGGGLWWVRMTRMCRDFGDAEWLSGETVKRYCVRSVRVAGWGVWHGEWPESLVKRRKMHPFGRMALVRLC